MKLFVLLLLLPVFSFSQTIHRDGKKILYTGDVSLMAHSSKDVLSMLNNAVHKLVKKEKRNGGPLTIGDTLSARGEMDLKMVQSLGRKLHYTIRLAAKEDGYAYTVDSVYVTERKFGEKEKTKKDKELLADMEISGPVSESSEKLLNEIDMNVQKLLVMLEKEMKKELSARQ